MLAKFFIVMLIRGEPDLPHLLQVLEGVNYSVFGTMKFFTIALNFKKLQNIYTTLTDIYPKTRKAKLAYRVRKHFWPKMDANYPLPLYNSCGLNYHFAFSGKCGKICSAAF